MPFDLGSDLLEYFISLIRLILAYISRIAMWIGLLIVVNQSIRSVIYKNMRGNLSIISKGIAILIISIIFYSILA
jgi:hypothetical protein